MTIDNGQHSLFTPGVCNIIISFKENKKTAAESKFATVSYTVPWGAVGYGTVSAVLSNILIALLISTIFT
ncbi:MAG: hypothetical protein KID00_11375 [Clostridium argentinense]|uniref:hypothetical protein n=1 Tax=Clostridium butanoliproducens TaxID=2991837 RepID=UPI001E123CD8|nr:hypothetical protein [Clostridium butanoliproducens]MBS5824435.1 hypothetical protein [Clostridium argentinense]